MRTRGSRSAILGALLVSFLLGCETLPDRNPVGPVEIQRPEFLGVVAPDTGQLEFALDGTVVFAFDERIDLSSLPGELTVSHLESVVPGTFTDGGRTLRDSTVIDTVAGQVNYEYEYTYFVDFSPSTPYEEAKVYNIGIYGGVKDIHGNSLSIEPGYSDSSWFFSTGDYNDGGWYTTYVLETLTQEIQTFNEPDSTESLVSGLESAADIAMTPDGSKIIVANRTATGYVSIFDRTLANRTDVTVGVGPEFIQATDDYAFVVNTSANTVSTVDLSSNTESSVLSFTDGFDPGMPMLNEDGSLLVIASDANASAEQVKVLSVGGDGSLSEAHTVDFSADADMSRATSGIAVYNGEAFLVEDLSPEVHVVNINSGSFVETFEVFHQEIADGDTTVSGNSLRGLVGENGLGYIWSVDGYLYQLDLGTRIVQNSIELSSRPWDIDFTPQGGLMYISLATDEVIQIYDQTYLRLLATVPASSGSRYLAVGRIK